MISWCIKDLWGTKVMYCYVVKWPVFRLQRGSAKSPLAPSNFSSLCIRLRLFHEIQCTFNLSFFLPLFDRRGTNLHCLWAGFLHGQRTRKTSISETTLGVSESRSLDRANRACPCQISFDLWLLEDRKRKEIQKYTVFPYQ